MNQEHLFGSPGYWAVIEWSERIHSGERHEWAKRVAAQLDEGVDRAELDAFPSRSERVATERRDIAVYVYKKANQ